MRDFNGVELNVGNYIVFPNRSDLEVAKVLNIKGQTLKLSCHKRQTSANGKYTYKIISYRDILKDHNSYYYKFVPNEQFIILTNQKDIVDSSTLRKMISIYDS